MKTNFYQRSTFRTPAAILLTMLLAQCGTNPEASKFFEANNLARISVPHTGEIDWEALDCSASEYAAENGFSHFARADVTMKVVGGYAQPPAVLSNAEGNERVFAEYGFYSSEADWNTVKDDRIGMLKSARDVAAFCA